MAILEKKICLCLDQAIALYSHFTINVEYFLKYYQTSRKYLGTLAVIMIYPMTRSQPRER